MRLAIGIDTGGTCTDAILYDFDTGTVRGQSKALTTYDDLTRGILQALDGLDPSLCRQARVAGLSTTLATNACVEGKFRQTRLLLLGIDRHGVARYGADYGFTNPDAIRYLPCKTTITGQIQEEPDWALLQRQAKDWFADGESCAICEIYGIRNGGVLEKRAAQIIREETGLPTVCASELFAGLSSLERAVSAVLNAGLLPLTQQFIQAVTVAFRQRDIDAEIMIVRSDSNLMGLNYSAEHAVETLLSGPAASALGGSVLTGQECAIVVDMGGTTTDIALIEEHAPLLEEGGIRVGKWKTLVNGLFATSFALGGDSAIRWDKNCVPSLGPNRVIPLCVLAEQYPAIVPTLQQQVRDVPRHTLPLHEFLTLGRADWRTLPLSESDKRLCAALDTGDTRNTSGALEPSRQTPCSLTQAADWLGIDKYQLHTEALEQSGVILRAGLTPTDIMHVRGDYTRYNCSASRLAVQFAATSLGWSVETLCDWVYEEISRRLFVGISELLLEHASPYYRKHGLDTGMQELLRLQWETRRSRFLDYRFRVREKCIGTGGPIHLFLPEAAKALGTSYQIPACAATANAVGAVAGQITASAQAEIRPHGLSPTEAIAGDYEVLCTGLPPAYFAEEEEAIAWATQQLQQYTAQRVRERGGAQDTAVSSRSSLSFSTERQQAVVGAVKLGTTVTVTARTNLLQMSKSDRANAASLAESKDKNRDEEQERKRIK